MGYGGSAVADNPRIRGDTPDEKFSSIQQILRSLSRRLVKRAVVYIPPVPILMGCGIVGHNNIVGRTVVPFQGTLRDIFVRVGVLHTKQVKLSLTLTSDTAETKFDFVIAKQFERIAFERDIVAGTSIQLALEEGSLEDALIATAVYPHIDEHQGQKFLLEAILAQEKEEDQAQGA